MHAGAVTGIKASGCFVRQDKSTAATAAAAGAMHQQTEAAASDDVFRVRLNPSVAASMPPHDAEALQREFADWFAGPVLLPVGTEVRLVPQQDSAYAGLLGTVCEHLATDPRIVSVHL